MEQLEELIFQLIANSGSARSNIFEALDFAQDGNFEKAKELMEEAKKEILEAHQIQTELIQKEAQGEKIEMNILMVHAQDHLMASMLAKDLVEKMIEMQLEIDNLKKIRRT
mgnify:CR=1 FL=1